MAERESWFMRIIRALLGSGIQMSQEDRMRAAAARRQQDQLQKRIHKHFKKQHQSNIQRMHRRR